MARFFVSYTSVDSAWAEWIAWVLEEEGHTVILQKWDFRPGGNFVVEMQKAAAKADRTIAVLSPEYLKSSFATPEWVAAFVDDPTGSKFKLVPVRVRECNPEGLWKAVIYIDLVGADQADARQLLLDGLKSKRAKPTSAPQFPGASAHAAAPFPGPTKSADMPASAPYIPKLRKEVSDLDRKRFAQQGFKQIQQYFESALPELKSTHPEIDVDLTRTSAADFSAEIFVGGKSKCRCRIWLGGVFGANEIAYTEGNSISGNAMNDSLSIAIDRGDLAFRTIMGGHFGRLPSGIDGNHITADQAGEYFWRRFVAPFER